MIPLTELNGNLQFDIRKLHSFSKFKRRFLSKLPKDYLVEENKDSCWNWQATKTRNGYGQIWYGDQTYLAHRMAYIIFNDLIPYDNVVRHTCNNPSCVNPTHLITGTDSENSIDMVKAGRQWFQKLSVEDVKEIKRQLKHSPRRGLAVKLARKYNVHKDTISCIKRGRSWGWLTV